ncbi:unnamed protein product [Peniophora sp. CBMAI 1063]|nr:unnamed protein product [Peniophora sp. CBMAI 1063]
MSLSICSLPVEADRRRMRWEPVWLDYLKSIAEEGTIIGKNSAVTASASTTFAGIFAAIVSAFLIESYKSLKPDTGAQTVFILEQILVGRDSNTTGTLAPNPPPFHVSETDVLVNTLWFAGLVISLMAALLATLYQEWIRQFLKAENRTSDETVEEHSLRHLSIYVGARWYGLDLVAPCIVGMMHFAVALFFYGMHLFLSNIHPQPAWWTTRLILAGTIVYVAGSFIPLFDATCFYRTPLTSFAARLIVILVSVVVCVATYFGMLLCAATLLLRRCRLHPVWSYLLGLRLWWGILRDPLYIPRGGGGAVAYAKQRFLDGISIPISFWDFVIECSETGDVPQYYPPMGGHELGALVDHVGMALLDYPAFLFRLCLELLNPQNGDVGEFFVRIRRDPGLVEKLAADLEAITTVDEAAGAARALQMVLYLGTNDDDMRQAASDQAIRWEFLDPILDALPHFVSLLNHYNVKAMGEGDIIIVAAVCSLRWSLLLLWKRIPSGVRAHSLAAQRLQCVFLAFEGSHSSLRLLPLSTDHERSLDRLFASDVDPCRELALRNAMTLLSSALRCNWEGPWREADVPYLCASTWNWDIPYLSSTRTLWEWNKEFPDTHRRRRKLPASAAFQDLLQDARLYEWTEPNATLTTPAGTNCPPDVVRALRDLASTVDIHAPRPCVPVANGRHTPPTQDRDPSTTLVSSAVHSPEARGPLTAERPFTSAVSHHTQDTVNGFMPVKMSTKGSSSSKPNPM